MFQDIGGQQRKTKVQLIRLSAAVCGIELCYAAETAFVSPILLKLGVPVSLMTMIWCLSPVLGFFLVPFMGSLSDRCPLALGRRRPFILVMSVGIVLGLVLVPNGEALGRCHGSVLHVRLSADRCVCGSLVPVRRGPFVVLMSVNPKSRIQNFYRLCVCT